MKNKIVAATLQVSGALLLIKLLGVLKQSLIASICGATAETDAYFVASGIIIHLCGIAFSAVSISLLSMYTERLLSKGRESANNLINAVLRVFMPISVCITVLFVAFSPLLAKLFAPSYQGEQKQMLAYFIRIMSVMFVFTCYFLIVNVVLETDKRFLPGKGQSFFQNLFICIALVTIYPVFGISALIYAFLLAGIVQCIQITWNARRQFKFVKHIESEKKAINKLLKLALPLLVGSAVYEINDIVDKQIATGLGQGNVSYLSYGASINEIVTTLIIQSVSTVLFSHYATWIAEGNNQKVGENLKKSIEYLVVFIMPVMIVCFISGDSIVRILYGRGNFDDSAVLNTTSVVFGYAAGFLFNAMRANIVRVYYAFQDTKTPMINGAISVAVNVMTSILLSRVIGVGGIALATSIAMLLVSTLLLPGIKKYISNFSLKGSLPEYGKAVAAAAVVGVCAFFLRRVIPFGPVLSFICIGSFVLIGYLLIAFALKIRPVKELSGKIIARIKHK